MIFVNKIITLTTDFGTSDYFTGAMKGVILSICQNADIIDITHEIEPQNVRQGAFVWHYATKEFPAGTIHVGVVDAGVGSARKAILLATEKAFFIAPDNGLISFVLENEPNFRVFNLTNEEFFRQPVSRTFHGRDIFAPVAAHLAGGVKPEECGTEIFDFERFPVATPQITAAQTIIAEIIHIDRFGNLITNLRRTDLPAEFTLEINGQKIEKLQNFFAEAENSEVFMIFGSADLLEIVAFCDSAEKILNAKIGQELLIKLLKP